MYAEDPDHADIISLPNSMRWADRCELHVHMYALADKYGAPSLKQQARQRFLLSFYDVDEYDIAAWPCPHGANANDGDDVGKDDSSDFFEGEGIWKSYLNIIRMVYNTTPQDDKGLRDIMLEFLQSRLHSKASEEVIEVHGLRQLIAETADLSYDLATNYPVGRMVKCNHCQFKFLWKLTWRCQHGHANQCYEYDEEAPEACDRKFKKESFCWKCQHLGTLEMIWQR